MPTGSNVRKDKQERSAGLLSCKCWPPPDTQRLLPGGPVLARLAPDAGQRRAGGQRAHALPTRGRGGAAHPGSPPDPPGAGRQRHLRRGRVERPARPSLCPRVPLPARACVPVCPCPPEPVSPCAPEVPWRVTPFCLLRKPHFNGDTTSARSSATVKHADDSSRVNAEPKLPKTVFSQS